VEIKKSISILIILLFVFKLVAQEEVDKNPKPKFEASYSLAIGGESKFAFLLPKINVARRHQFPKIDFYYGVGIGAHTSFVGGFGSFNGFIGVEKNRFDLETSFSHFWITRTPTDEDVDDFPFHQNLINLKIGYRIKNSIIRIGTSFLLSEKTTAGLKRNKLLDVGKINGRIYGIEVITFIK